MNPVATTGLLVAAIRAEESRREDRLFDDPFAERLAGDRGVAALALYRASPISIPIIEVRTRFFDEALARAADAGVRQFVIVAAGMDARAYRLAWPAGVRVFELDQADVLDHKASVLHDAAPTCDRVAVPADLAVDFSERLRASGLDPAAPTAWLIEGLLQYLDDATVAALFARIDRLSSAGSVLLYDVVGRTLFDSPMLAKTKQMMSDLGAPWRFATDAPASLLAAASKATAQAASADAAADADAAESAAESAGAAESADAGAVESADADAAESADAAAAESAGRWTATVVDPGEPGTRWGRWPFPPAPAHVQGVPRGYLIEARKD